MMWKGKCYCCFNSFVVHSLLEDFDGEKDGIVKTENMAKQAVIADNVSVKLKAFFSSCSCFHLNVFFLDK